MPVGHIAGIPVEETLMMAAPPLTTFVGVLVAGWRSRRERRAERRPSAKRDGPSTG